MGLWIISFALFKDILGIFFSYLLILNSKITTANTISGMSYSLTPIKWLHCLSRRVSKYLASLWKHLLIVFLLFMYIFDDVQYYIENCQLVSAFVDIKITVRYIMKITIM